jgi:L-fuconolactonase
MLDFPIVDTHVHLWDPARISYPWLEHQPQLNRPFLLEDYDQALGPIQVEKLVFLQCDCDFSQFMAEAEWVASLAAQEPRLQGMVPWAPIEKGEAVRPDLERLAQNPLVKGVRRLLQSEAVDFCLQPDFIKGVQALADYDLTFDICIYHFQMANAIKMVEQCPQVNFILDHIGKPDIKTGRLEPWQTEIKQLSELPNVWCKISGLVTEADHQLWTKEDLKPYIDHVIDCFGFDRVMYGSDWPVATLATDYTHWVETLFWATVSTCAEVELRKLFRENAIRFYRLDAAASQKGN